jgi:ABC-type multidrug transport system fused ATPase/permease subunit
VSSAALRGAVGYAFERPALLGGTVAGMIALGGGRVEWAARVAQADGFTRRLPRGYDTSLDGAPLSGGEAQRLGLARAVAGDARLLVLDDATSSVDTVTEARICEVLTDSLAGRTRVVIAHRAATVARCDLVAWLDGGRVRAMAPHHELWRDPAYRRLFGGSS